MRRSDYHMRHPYCIRRKKILIVVFEFSKAKRADAFASAGSTELFSQASTTREELKGRTSTITPLIPTLKGIFTGRLAQM